MADLDLGDYRDGTHDVDEYGPDDYDQYDKDEIENVGDAEIGDDFGPDDALDKEVDDFEETGEPSDDEDEDEDEDDDDDEEDFDGDEIEIKDVSIPKKDVFVDFESPKIQTEEIGTKRVGDVYIDDSKFESKTKDMYQRTMIKSLKDKAQIIKPEFRTSRNVISRYEYARLIGARADAIIKTSEAFVELNGMTDPLDIAQKEYQEGKIGIMIRRKIDPTKTEIWHVDELINLSREQPTIFNGSR